jgi:hypothetical protein
MRHPRPDAKVYQGVIRNSGEAGMTDGANPHCDGIKAFSDIDQTDDQKAMRRLLRGGREIIHMSITI